MSTIGKSKNIAGIMVAMQHLPLGFFISIPLTMMLASTILLIYCSVIPSSWASRERHVPMNWKTLGSFEGLPNPPRRGDLSMGWLGLIECSCLSPIDAIYQLLLICSEFIVNIDFNHSESFLSYDDSHFQIYQNLSRCS